MSEAATTTCRHETCGKRFDLSRYSNQTSTSKNTRKGRHLFCSGRCRTAHSRRLASLRDGVIEPEATIVAGGVTSLEITQQFQQPLPPKLTTDQPYFTRSDEIVGPHDVIHAEVVAGRKWTEEISAGGVRATSAN